MPIYPSQYSFTQPVRYFKANDPYYYEVDNIPVRQLEENILWLKDQYSGFLGVSSTGSQLGFLKAGDDIDWGWIKQFRPKWVSGRQIKIQAGKYTGRVNDAYDKESTALAVTHQVSPGANELIARLSEGPNTTLNDYIWKNFAGTLGESANPLWVLGANCGLETMFTFHAEQVRGISNTTVGSDFGSPAYQEVLNVELSKTWPAMFHGKFYAYLSGPNSVFPLSDFNALGRRHLELVRKWKGVFRTAVMDFREETIEVDPFDTYDYFVEDPVTSNKTQITGATQRLDLIVVYGHPVDSSSTAIDEYPGTNPEPTEEGGGGGGSLTGVQNVPPRVITEPRLGIIRGAGIGIKNATNGAPTTGVGLSHDIELNEFYTAPGKQKILANPAAEGGLNNTGIRLADGSIVNGSFPSPDDLGNLAPNLAYDLASNDFQMIGQCVLPICYVIVKEGTSTLSQESIIDIRPFLRSAEFTYNERAGVAAANPPLSLANPAVGVAQLQDTYDELKGSIPPQIEFNPTQVTGGRAPQQYWGYPFRVVTWRGPTQGERPWAERGEPTGTGSYSADGIFFNDVFSIPTSLMAFGVGTCEMKSADHDGFSSHLGTNTVVDNLYQRITNPLFDGTYAANAPGYTQSYIRYMQGIPILNLDLSFYDGYATAELVAADIKNVYAVAANAYVGGFWEQGHDNETLAVRASGWRVVKRGARYYMIVSCDVWGSAIGTLAGINASCNLIKKDITSTAGPTAPI